MNITMIIIDNEDDTIHEQLIMISCNMNAFFSFDLFMVYIPECKQQLRTMKIQDIAHFKSGL
jgi:hypothetical protein